MDLSHVSTHIPRMETEGKVNGGEGMQKVIIHPSTLRDTFVRSTGVAAEGEGEVEGEGLKITTRQPPPLVGTAYPILIDRLDFPLDPKHWPKDESYWSVLIIRNLGRALREEIERSEGEEIRSRVDGDGDGMGMGMGMGGSVDVELRRRKKKDKIDSGELFGLPIPEAIRRGEEASGGGTGKNSSGDLDNNNDKTSRTVSFKRLTKQEQEKAKIVFEELVVGRVLEMIGDRAQVARYLMDGGMFDYDF